MTRPLRFRLLAPLALACAAASPLSAQNVEDVVGRYIGDNANGFLQPLADVLGAGMSSGWASTADIPGGLHLKISTIVAGTPISDDARVFAGTTSGFSPEQSVNNAPTIFGSADPLTVSGTGGTAYVFPGGLDISMMGVVAPQLTVGTIAGTEAMVRWVPTVSADEFGDISLLGLGGRHDLDQYFGVLPVELTAGVFWQKFEVGDVVSSSTLLGMVHASKGLGPLTLFGGLGYETSSTDISVQQAGGGEALDISLDGANSVRMTGGVALRLLILGIYADYTLASQNSFTLGVELGR